MISFISSLEIINLVILDPNILLWISVFVVNAATVNPNGIKTLLANALIAFPIKGNLAFSNGPKSLLRILLIFLIYATEFLIIFY